jgi:translin
MEELESIAERIHQSFETRTAARDQALSQARSLIRHCSQAIRAIHRDDEELITENLVQAKNLVENLQKNLSNFPDLYYSGYTQDAFKEYAEACIVNALVKKHSLPSPEDLGLEYATYLQGLAEAAGELRRRCLDILRNGHSKEAERLLTNMDDIYAVLVTMDYPDAITGGLRRLTDIVRSLNERTRGDMTISVRQEHLEYKLKTLTSHLEHINQQD